MSKIKKWFLVVFVVISITITTAFQSDFFEVAKQIDIYTTLFKDLNMYYIDEINPAKLTNTAISNMLSTLDPYTQYYDEQGVEDARIKSTGDYGGIGAVSRFYQGELIIREIIKNSPAEEVGIKPGDKVLKIDNLFVKDFDEEGITSLLNGLPNTNINLQIERQNNVLNFEVTRKKIEINPVPFYTMLANEVGYISLTQFNEKASEQVKEAFLDLKNEGMQKLIIDVRGNPGGLLNEAVNITNYFISKDKIVVTTKAKIEQWSDVFKTKNEPLDLEIPIAILINNRSASASEILAGSLQDYDRAVIIGERSFGKGLVQRYLPLSYGTQMKITISKYYTPSGRCIQELDYKNRDENGNVPTFSDEGITTYKTENGRIVYGGGGILPDVNMEKPKTTITTETLLSSNAFFNYATDYFYKNTSITEPSKFNLGEADYKSLINYLEKHQSDFETTTEIDFNLAKEKAESEDLSKTITTSYTKLLETIHSEKINELEKNKTEILTNLTDEIVKRYYYEEGVYQQKAAFDTIIKKAASVLNNQATYESILKN
jgi:carboxyl-terminal processing protease